MAENVTGIVKHRNASSAALIAQNTVILAGELVIETDTHQFKFGDGSTQYASLEYGKVPALTTARLIQLTGDVSGSVSFDGSADVTITATVADDSHNHVVGNIDNFTENVQDITGAMVSGNTENGISVTYDDTAGKLNFNVNDPTITLSGDVSGSAVMTNLGNVTITTTVADDSHNHIISNVDGLQTALDGKLSTTGTAASATKLATARTIGGVSFDGTANINLPGVNTAGNQNTSGSSASCTGNAATATKLATARTISLGGDCSGSTTFDGSANKTITVTVANNSHSHTTANITGLNTAMLNLLMPVGFQYTQWFKKDGVTPTNAPPSTLWPGFGTWTARGDNPGNVGYEGDTATVWERTS